MKHKTLFLANSLSTTTTTTTTKTMALRDTRHVELEYPRRRVYRIPSEGSKGIYGKGVFAAFVFVCAPFNDIHLYLLADRYAYVVWFDTDSFWISWRICCYIYV